MRIDSPALFTSLYDRREEVSWGEQGNDPERYLYMSIELIGESFRYFTVVP